MIDVETLSEAFQASQKLYGKDKFSEAEVIEMASRGATPILRKSWCKVFRLEDSLASKVMALPYVEDAQKPARMPPADIQRHMSSALKTGYQTTGLSPAQIRDVAQHILDSWDIDEPQRRNRTPLRVFNSSSVTPDVERLESWLIPWVAECSPGAPSNMRETERLERVKRWWEGAVHAVYESPRLNGLVPGRLGCSLEWLSGCEVGADGRRYPKLRLERAISGEYDKRRE